MMDILRSNILRINLEYLYRLKKSVKNNFEGIADVSDILDLYPFLRSDILSRIENSKLFQPGRIVETMVIQSISDFLECQYVGNGAYENENYFITQDGGSGKSDLFIYNKSDKIKYIFEIKEPVAYGKSSGFIYDISGKVTDFTSEDSNFIEYIKSLFGEGNILENYNILESQGHNVMFDIMDIKTNIYDYIISYNKNGILDIMTNEEYRERFNFQIEVRSCGKNERKVFTKDFLDINDDIVFLNKSDLCLTKPRGGKIPTKYKYIKNGATFKFKIKDVLNENGRLSIHIDKIKQVTGEISIIHKIKTT